MSCEDKCKTIVLAKNANCRVDGCSCGVIRLTYGGLSLRLTADSFLQLAWTTEEAALRLVDTFEDRSKLNLRALEDKVH